MYVAGDAKKELTKFDVTVENDTPQYTTENVTFKKDVTAVKTATGVAPTVAEIAAALQYTNAKGEVEAVAADAIDADSVKVVNVEAKDGKVTGDVVFKTKAAYGTKSFSFATEITAAQVAETATQWHTATKAFEKIKSSQTAFKNELGTATLTAKVSDLTADKGGAPTDAIWAGLHINAVTGAKTADFKVTGTNPRSLTTEILGSEGNFANGFFYFFPVGVEDKETAKGGVPTAETAKENNNVLTLVWKDADGKFLKVETLTVKYVKTAEEQ